MFRFKFKTFEEAITHMMTFGQNIGEKQLPIRLYQVSLFLPFFTSFFRCNSSIEVDTKKSVNFFLKPNYKIKGK